MENILTKKQEEMIWKKELIIELANKGLTRKEIHEQLNKELRENGLRELGMQFIYKYTKLLGLTWK